MFGRFALPLVVFLTLAAVACGEVDTSPIAPSDSDLVAVDASNQVLQMTPAPEASSARNYVAPLDPGQEVPPVESRATGATHLQLSMDRSELSYRLNVGNIEDVTMAHIHMAPPGVNGGIVAWLYPSGPPPQLIPGRSSGTLATGVITDGDVVGDLEGEGLEGLLEAIEAGNTYVNVHTSAHPAGEIRGQIQVAGPH